MTTIHGLLSLYPITPIANDEVVDFQKKLENPNSTLASIACYGLTADTLPKLAEYLAEDNSPDEPGWFLQWLQDRKTVHAFTFDEA